MGGSETGAGRERGVQKWGGAGSVRLQVFVGHIEGLSQRCATSLFGLEDVLGQSARCEPKFAARALMGSAWCPVTKSASHGHSEQ